MRRNSTNSTSFPRALCLSLSKCANGFISPHRICTINELQTARLTQVLSQFTCIITKVYNLYNYSLPILNYSALVRSSVCSLNNCPIVKTKIHSMIKHLITFFEGEKKSKYSPSTTQIKINPPSHKSNLRGEFTPFSKMKLRI